MRKQVVHAWSRGRIAILTLVLMGGSAALAQTGSISGMVKAKETGAVLPGANVTIVGTTMGVAAGADGGFTLANVPAGTYKVRVTFLGYQEQTRAVVVADGQTAIADFNLEESAILGETVVVSASRRVEKLTEAPATIAVINAKGIDEFPAFNPGELAARQKGVDYVRSGVLGAGLNIRGFNSAFNAKNLQMNDARLSTLVATSLPLGALSTTVKEDIERVELILGPAAALYGPNAHNGLVNTITKDPRTYPGTMVAFGGGNQSVVSGRFRHANVVNEKFAYKVSGEYSRGEEFDFIDSVYVGGRPFPELNLDRDFDSIRGETALYYSLKPGTDMVLSGGYSNSNNLGVTNAGRNQIIDWKIYYMQARYVSPRLFAQVYNTWSRTEDTFALNQRTQNYRTYVTALLPDGTRRFSDAEAVSRSLHTQWSATLGHINREANFKDKSRRLNAEVQYNNTWSGFTVIGGAQFQQDVANSEHTYLLDQSGEINLNQTGVYGQVEKPLGDTGFKVMVAARADDHELYGSNFIPKAGLLYTSGAGTYRVTYGKGIASPSILNLSANIFGGLLLGNGEGFTLSDGTKIPKLEVETIQSFEAGYKGVIQQKLFVDVNGYYNISENFLSPTINIATLGRRVTHRGGTLMSDLIPGTPVAGSAFVLTYLNFGNVNTYGFDLGLNYYLSNQVNVTVNYSYFDFDLDKNDLTNDANKNGRVTDDDLPINTPKHKASLGLGLSQSKYFGNVFVRWVDEYDFFSGINVAAKTNPNLLIGVDPVIEGRRVGRDFNEGPLGGFVNVDISAGYRITPNISIAGHATNLLDDEVREFVASPSIGRLFSAELKLTL
jgi:iron complex outermembrane receptor protein